jgi:hypothetical protein
MVRALPKAIKGVLAHAAAVSTPWRKNIRRENAKFHLHESKAFPGFESYVVSHYGNLIFLGEPL